MKKKNERAATAREFRAVVGGEDGMRPAVEIPFDVREAFGAARAKVKATVNGVELRTTVAVYGGRSYVGFRKEIRDAAKIEIGDTIKVRLEKDEEPRVAEVPEALARAFAQDKVAKAAFDALAFTHQKEYAAWIAGAKQETTKETRVAKTLTMLRAGVKHP